MEFELKIKFNTKTKACGVTGPMNNKELCLLGLELARGVVEQYHRDKARTLIMPSVPIAKKLIQNGG